MFYRLWKQAGHLGIVACLYEGWGLVLCEWMDGGGCVCQCVECVCSIARHVSIMQINPSVQLPKVNLTVTRHTA